MKQFCIFDFDGTVADSMYVWDDSAPALLRRLGHTPPPDLTRRIVHMSITDTLNYLRQEYHLTQTADELMDMVMEMVEQAYRETVPPKPGIRRVLDTLQARDCRCCIATSNESSLVQLALERMGLDRYFDFILSTEPGAGKDKPDVFLKALARMGGSDPAQAAVFEDTPVCMSTALRAGFTVYAMADHSVSPDEIPAGVRAYLETWDDWTENL